MDTLKYTEGKLTDELRAGIKLVNAFLDEEALAETGASGALPPLLRQMKGGTNVGKFQEMIEFADLEWQKLLNWRSCMSHKARLEQLDLKDSFGMLHVLMDKAHERSKLAKQFLDRKHLEERQIEGKCEQLVTQQKDLIQTPQSPLTASTLAPPRFNSTLALDQQPTINDYEKDFRASSYNPAPQQSYPLLVTRVDQASLALTDPSTQSAVYKDQEFSTGGYISHSSLGLGITNELAPFRMAANRNRYASSQPPSLLRHSKQRRLRPARIDIQMSSSEIEARERADWDAQVAQRKVFEVEKKATIKRELDTMIKEGVDVLACRYHEYLEIYPCEWGSRPSPYHVNLLANQPLEPFDTSVKATAVRYAKEKWYNYWDIKDMDMVTELVKKQRK